MLVKVARVSEIDEGRPQLVEAAGKSIALFKIGSKIFALDSACCHRGGPLAAGYFDGAEVTCPWHAWSFNVKTGVCLSEPDRRQPSYKVRTKNGDIFLDIKNSPE